MSAEYMVGYCTQGIAPELNQIGQRPGIIPGPKTNVWNAATPYGSQCLMAQRKHCPMRLEVEFVKSSRARHDLRANIQYFSHVAHNNKCSRSILALCLKRVVRPDILVRFTSSVKPGPGRSASDRWLRGHLSLPCL